MKTVQLEYLKCNKYESEIEIFWIDIKKDILISLDDESIFQFNMKREFVGAVSGEFAGIIIQILLSIPPCIDATFKLWSKVNSHFELQRKKDRIPRILSMNILENICRFKLIEQGVEKLELIKSKKLIQENESSDSFSYCDDAYKCNVAKFIFVSDKNKYSFIIDNDGEVTHFKKSKR